MILVSEQPEAAPAEAVSPPLKWRCIFGFEGYQVSSDGDVRRLWRSASGENRSTLLKATTDKRGRRRFTLCLGGRPVKVRASRLVLEAFVGPCPQGMEACHENGNERDDRLTNLRWDTHSANLLDRRRHGTNVQGEKVNTAKLTADDVRAIRVRRAGGETLRELSDRYGVSQTMVSLIARRKNWQHV